jgi:four helix bundle protein
MDFAVDVYQLTTKFPQGELYGLISQMRRAAVSAPSNIAEGAADRTRQQFLNFCLTRSVHSMRSIHNWSLRYVLRMRPELITTGSIKGAMSALRSLMV